MGVIASERMVIQVSDVSEGDISEVIMIDHKGLPPGGWSKSYTLVHCETDDGKRPVTLKSEVKLA